MNITVDQILIVLASLIGVPALLALLIDVLKWAGLVTDGNAPKVSAAFNLIALIVVAAILQFYPAVDIPSLDGKLSELVKFGALVFSYVIQIVNTKAVHRFMTRKLKIAAFSHNMAYYRAAKSAMIPR